MSFKPIFIIIKNSIETLKILDKNSDGLIKNFQSTCFNRKEYLDRVSISLHQSMNFLITHNISADCDL